MGRTSARALAVEDPTRPLIGRAVRATLAAVAIFLLFCLTKQDKHLFAHAPWMDDPYDTVLSFTMLFVPVVAAVLVVRASLCIKSQPVLVSRARSVLRTCRAALWLMGIEQLFAWVAVALGANTSQRGPDTAILLAALALSTLSTVAGMGLVRRAGRSLAVLDDGAADAPDLLSDAALVVIREARTFGFEELARIVIGSMDRHVLSTVRRHPIMAAIGASGCFSLAVFGFQAVQEGTAPSVAAIEVFLGFCGMFSLLVSAGSYLEIVRGTRPLSGLRRRALDATVASCGAAVCALAFRSSLWWLVDAGPTSRGPDRFAALVAMISTATLLLVLAIEGALGVHPRTNG
jgi:hypothetical protein